MGGIAEESELPLHPRREHVHVQELPHLEGVRLGLVQEGEDGGVEVFEYLEKAAFAHRSVPFYERESELPFIQRWNVAGELLTAFGSPDGQALVARVDADKVELAVGVAGVHDDPPVLSVPYYQLAIPRNKVFGHGVVQGNLAGDEEPEGALSGWLGLHVAAGNLGSSDRL